MFILLFLVPSAVLAAKAPILHTSTGKLQGFVKTAENGLQSEVYLSVPFARPATGALRFAKPQPYDDPEAEIDATQKHPACPQHEIKLSEDIYLNFTWYSENCLFLDIFKPTTNATNLPIVLYLFGGTYLQGSSSMLLYEGDVFASETNTIYVIVNYRVGLFGFMNIGTEEAPGNQGLWDAVEALRWLNKNAGAIGGNPDDITLWGQSAGAITTGILMASPVAKGLFHKAIFQSGATNTGSLLFKQNTPDKTKAAFVKLGCMNDTDDWETTKSQALQCVKQMNVDEVLEKTQSPTFNIDVIKWQPVIGDELIPVNPFSGKDQQLFHVNEVLMTSVASEGVIFAEILEKRAGGPIEALGDIRTLMTLGIKTLFGISTKDAKRITKAYIPDGSDPVGDDLRQMLSSVCSDVLFICPMDYFAESARRNDIKVYRASFEGRSSLSVWPKYSVIGHGDDVGFTSGKILRIHETYSKETAFPPNRIVNPISPEEASWVHDTLKILGDFIRNG